MPLLRRNYFIISKHHSNSPFIIIYNSWIMIVFLVWYFLFIISLIHSFCKIISFFTFLWIFILLILPSFRNHNTIIPKIITYSVSIFIFYIWIKLILFIWYYSLHSKFHSFSLFLFIFFEIITIILLFILYLLFFNFFFLFFTFPIIWYIYLFLF